MFTFTLGLRTFALLLSFSITSCLNHCQVLLPSTSSTCVARASVTAISHYFTHIFLCLSFFHQQGCLQARLCHFSFPRSRTIFSTIQHVVTISLGTNFSIHYYTLLLLLLHRQLIQSHQTTFCTSNHQSFIIHSVRAP